MENLDEIGFFGHSRILDIVFDEDRSQAGDGQLVRVETRLKVLVLLVGHVADGWAMGSQDQAVEVCEKLTRDRRLCGRR